MRGRVLLAITAAAVVTACGSSVIIDPSGGSGGSSGSANGGSDSGTSVVSASSGSSSVGSGGSGPGPGACEGAFVEAIAFGSPGQDTVEEMVLTPDGEIVVAGLTVGPVVVAGGGVSQIGLGGDDAFLARFAADLTPLSLVTFGNGSDQRISGMALAPGGHLVVVGDTEGLIDFGGGPLPPTALGQDIFVAMLTSDGQHVWSRRFQGNGDDFAQDVTVDALGYITLVGSFKELIQVDGTTLISNGGSDDVVVIRLSPDGTTQWVQQFGDQDFQIAHSVGATSDGGVAITGSTRGKIDFGGGPFGPEPGGVVMDAFLVRLDADGQHVWSAAVEGPEMERGRTLAVDSTDAVIAAGQFHTTAHFMGLPISSAGQTDVFMLKVAADGTPEWVQSWGDNSIQNLRELTTTVSNQILIGMPVSGSLDFGCGPAGTAAGEPIGAFVKFNPDGSSAFSMHVGDPPEGQISFHQYGTRALQRPGGDLVVLGSFNGAVQLGDQAFSSVGALDTFVGIVTDVP